MVPPGIFRNLLPARPAAWPAAPQHAAGAAAGAGRGVTAGSSSRTWGVCLMLDQPVVNKFAHVKPGDTPWVAEGLRDFFLYRDLGVADATGGRVLAQLVKANPDRPPEHRTGWRQPIAGFYIVLMN